MTEKPVIVNPLNLFNLRRVNHCPPHFFAVDFDISAGDKKISDWIYENLSGRFFLDDAVVFVGDQTKITKRAAFEIHGEATYFALQLNEINKF